jgi:uncharacterized protein (DUF885 family)
MGIGAVLLALLIVGGAFVVNLVWFRPFSINLFYERVFIEHVLRDPELLTNLRILEPLGLDFHSDDLTDASPDYARELLAKAKDDLATLNSYDRDKQTPEQLLSTDILGWFLQDSVQAEPFLFYNYPVNQLFGMQSELPDFMATQHLIFDTGDAEAYLARLRKFPRKFGQVIEGLRLREEMGIVPPRFVIDRVIDQMEGFRATAAEQNILYTAFEEKLEAIDGLPAPERAPLVEACRAAIEEAVYPAYDTLLAYLRELAPKATTDDGVWKFPNGDAFYAYALRSQTTSDYTPAEVNNIGLAETARVQAEMEAILAGLGRVEGTVAERMAALAKDPQYLYANTDEGRAACIAEYQAIIDEVDAGMSEVFDLRPAVGVEVEPIPAFKEKTAPGAYYQPPSLDGARPGVFYANLRDMAEIPQWGMRTLAFHEAIPGHHFQIAIQQQIEGPTFRKVLPFTAYIEGWALYAEQLAFERGFHPTPESNLGRLQAELFRAVRLVVDTGIHHKRWTREEAIAYMNENTGMPEGDVVAEIERYIVMPGQACTYKIGQLKILELRERARTALGDRFDLKAFHNVMLANGAMPLEILDQVVDRWIGAQ